MSGQAPIKVAIIGGGCAGMTTAFELSRPEHQGRYEITVYQMGWRLGGKGASGRGPAGRIEEHGLHIWMGWYENAFRIMRETYDELGRDPSVPLATWIDAFSPMERIGVVDQISNDEWQPFSAILPPMAGLPGDPLPSGQTWTVSHYFSRSVQLLTILFQTLQDEQAGAEAAPAPTEPSADALARMMKYGELATLAGMIQGVSMIGGLLQAALPTAPSLIIDILDAIATNGRRIIESRIGDDISLRRVWQIIDVTIATLRGLVRHGVATDPRGFDCIDQFECREWLVANGASESSLDTGYIRALYDLAFCYEDGDPSRPSMSAGQAIRGTLRMFFTYRGAFFYRMNAGMGDVVFAPLYELLLRRGVRFEFFHTLRNVKLGDDGSPHVAALEMDVQARTVDGSPYRPLVDVHGLPCWPSSPLYEQLEDGERLRALKPSYESPDATPVVASKVLEISKDFDFVVLGVGLGAVPSVCREILESNRKWKAMTEKVKTVATQAFQLWMSDDLQALGWNDGPVALSGFVEPFDTWADMTHLLPREAWNGNKPQSIAYFCNALQEPLAQPDAQALAHDNAVEFLDKHMRQLWPKAVSGNGFAWDRLVAAEHSSLTGPARFATQFWRANHEPSDRYVLSVPGSAKYRISPLDRTYDNFTVAGDWTSCGFNAGCVEGAVMSGRLAAHALSGFPRLEEIVGYDHP